ncbi:MAG: hypothetical protein Q4F79_10375 [Eubacteriales bacterium]|nr:hypothetical protein [Eubacteriales bacterium]
MKNRMVGIFALLVLLTGCGGEPAPGSADPSVVESRVVRQEPRTEEEFVAQAAAMVQTVFALDVSGYESEITIEDLELRFYSGGEPSAPYYLVAWREGDRLPCWLYRRGMPKQSTKEILDPNTLPDLARQFLTQTLGVEELSDEVELYAYSDRFAVLLRDTEGLRYHVLYTQADGTLCGYQIFDDEQSLHRFYEEQGAEKIPEEK